ncbi:hypothetical protein B0H11DRAFT_2040767 [Mycena galericulata]|nr:hypothetical protein B0H11DRAFT_2040767 [Mycena galericulata]
MHTPDIPLDGAPTLPQELIDAILDLTDKESLQSCSRVARSFRDTSQKHIFSHIEFKPAFRYWPPSDSRVQDLSQIFSCSPHLALNVRSISLIKRNGINPSWIRGSTFPTILPMLVNLTGISIESDFVGLDWHTLSNTLTKALHATVCMPSLTSIRLHYVRFERSTELISLLQCCRHLDSLVFCTVPVGRIDSHHLGTPILQLGLSVLEMDPFQRPLVHSVTSTFDLRGLQHLRTTLTSPEMEAEIQPILDSTEALTHYHAHLSHHRTDAANINLQGLSHLRTLEITIPCNFATSPDDYDPIGWTRNILATLVDPSPVERVVLNVIVEEPDLPYLHLLADLETLLVAPKMAALRTLTVNLDSFDLDFNIYGGERDLCEAFPILLEKKMLDIELRGVA